MSVRFVALLAVAACCTLAPANANAGRLFGHRAAGCGTCDVAPSCGCEIAPSCGCEIQASCDPCGSKRVGLFAKLRARRASNAACNPCAAPTCCEVAAPTCCEVAAPSCGCEIAPSCGCEVDVCCDPCAKKKRCGGLLKGLLGKFRGRKSSCCDPCAAPSCAVAAPSCGCEIAPSCGCGH